MLLFPLRYTFDNATPDKVSMFHLPVLFIRIIFPIVRYHIENRMALDMNTGKGKGIVTDFKPLPPREDR